MINFMKIFLSLVILGIVGCASAGSGSLYKDQNMDFGAIRTIAVMPFVNLSRESVGAERVRDIFVVRLLATESVYVLPPGEVARGVAMASITNPTAPSPEEVTKLCTIVRANAVITGVVEEYGELRAGTTAANVVSVSMQMMESQTGKTVWAASSTKGGITLWDRLFGGAGQAMNDTTVKTVDDLIDKLYK